MLVAIDTSTSLTGLACYDERGGLAECVWESGRDHTAQLLPQLTLMLEHLGRARDDISAVAVALGPGSWSGLRVGLSTAKGLALARDLPLIGVATLDALAYQYRQTGMAVIPLIRLGRDRFATARYGGGIPPRRESEPHNVTLTELCAEVVERAFFCGDVAGDVAETLRKGLGKRAHFPTMAGSLRRPAYLAELAWWRLQAGEVDNIATLEPIYLGSPVKTNT